MAYNKTNFREGDVLTAAHMNAIEDGIIAVEDSLSDKQDKLFNGVNLKTINGISLLGPGNIDIQGTEGSNITVDSFLSSTSTNPVQNKVLKNILDEKQDKLTSGQTLKTINNQSLLGSGNINITGDGASIAVDAELNASSKNPVQNNVITLALGGKQEKGDYATVEDLSSKQDKLEDVEFGENSSIAFGIQDSNGNIAFGIANDGTVNAGKLKVKKIESEDGVVSSGSSWLTGKHCFVLGDSLSADTKATGSWHQKFCELTGAILDPNLNRGWFSIGGTATIGTHTEANACCQMRAKRLVEYYNEGNKVDVIFIQNVNDINNNSYSAGINGKGSDTDLPFFENQVITYTNHVVETTTPSTDVINYFKENITTILNGVTPMTGTVIDMLYTRGGTSAKELQILTAPTSDGEIVLTFKHGANYRDDKFNVSVRAGMSIADVVAAIVDWQFVGVSNYDDVIGENGDSVVFSSPYSLTFDGGTTGVTATVTETGAISRYPVAFKSLDVSTFTNADNWAGEASVTYWSAQKGLIEYLQKNIPNAKIFYLILPYYKVTYPATEGSAYLRTDGSYNMEYWVQNGRGSASAQKLYAEQPLVAQYYGCPSIDVVSNCSISPINIELFYPSNDVHPKTAGYNAWGETIARMLTGK